MWSIESIQDVLLLRCRFNDSSLFLNLSHHVIDALVQCDLLLRDLLLGKGAEGSCQSLMSDHLDVSMVCGNYRAGVYSWFLGLLLKRL